MTDISAFSSLSLPFEGGARTSPYSTVTIQGGAPPTGAATPQFLRGSGAASNAGSGAVYAEGNNQRLSDTESLESVASSIHEKIQQVGKIEQGQVGTNVASSFSRKIV